jgi:hypothetical protein
MATRTTFAATASIGLALTASSAWASDADDWFGTQFDNINTSDGFSRRSVELGYTGRISENTRLGVKVSGHHLKEYGVRYKATEAKVRVSSRLNDKVSVSGSLGQGKVAAREGGPSRSLTSYRGRLNIDLTDKVSVGLEHEKDFTFRDQAVIGDDGRILSAKTTRADIEYRPTDRVKLTAETAHRKFSDGNRGREDRVGAYYAVAPGKQPGKPEVWTGVEASRGHYQYNQDQYWAPQKYRSAALVLDAKVPVTERLDFNSSLSVGRSKENGIPGMGKDYYASVGADFHLAKGARLYADAHYAKSRRNGDNWHENAVMVGVAFDT